MGSTVTRNGWVALFATVLALVVGISCMAMPTQAHAALAAGSPASQAKATYKASKSKLIGSWKLVQASDSKTKKYLKQLKLVNKKHTFTFKKNKKMVEKGRYGTNGKSVKKTTYKWVPLTKKKAYLVYKGTVLGTLKVKGKTLTLVSKVSGKTVVKWKLRKI